MNIFDTHAKGRVLNYDAYITWVDQLVENKMTSGENQKEILVEFTQLNQRRMKRLNKTVKLQDSLVNKLKNGPKQNWWVITEPWCGDSAQNLPVIAKMAEASEGKITLKIVMRHSNPELMEKYLTNGGTSIPKLVTFNDQGQELFTFGPRPSHAQSIAMAWKNNPGEKTWAEFENELHTWYAKDKTLNLQENFIELT